MHVLHISASPKREHSSSGRIARAFLHEYAQRNPDHEIRELNVFDDPAPAFGHDAAIAKFAPLFGEARTKAGEKAWADVQAIVADFDRADKVLLSCPMWNYSIPWALKAYLDNLMQPRLTFGYDPKTMQHVGLLRNRPLQMILTRSSVAPGHFGDFQLPYLRFFFDMIGIRDMRVLLAHQTTRPDAAAREAYIGGFEAEAREAAARF